MRQYRETLLLLVSYSMLKLHLERKMSDNSLSGSEVCRSRIGKYVLCRLLRNENALWEIQVSIDDVKHYDTFEISASGM